MHAPLDQCRMDEAPLALALDDALAQGRPVPRGRGAGGEGARLLCMPRVVREIAALERIGCEVVELRRIAGGTDVLAMAAADHEERLRRALRHVLAEHGVGPGGVIA